jgi:DMSO/TMAO reductase YedYZ molybdopterin-dependent catalytic subunit
MRREKDAPRRLGEKELRRLSRRELLKLAPLAAIGAFAWPGANERLVRRGLAFSDRISEAFFDPARRAPTFDDLALTPLERFPVNSYSNYDPASDPAAHAGSWTLTVGGMVARPGEYTLEQIRSLPKQAQNARHLCIEGWDVIGNFGGARLADFLRMVGADHRARFLHVACLDDYYSSYDLASCLHPQTLLCYEMYGRPLEAGHGAPLRIHMPVKLGYLSA